jgi:signal transduction histidine kinase
MWTRPARVEPGSVFYVVDRTGQIVAYPADPSARPALPSVRLPPVRNALLGEHGVEVLRPDASDEEWVYAYEPVAKTGWAVIAAQPSSKTFAVRNEALWRIGLASALVVLCSSALTGVILSALVDRHLASESIQKLNKSLERRAAELEEANHELDSFSYSVSHDLRAPLRSIDGFCRALREDCSNLLDDPGRDHIARLESASRRMGTLIEGLLSLARTTRVQLGEEQVDLAALARRIADELRRTDPQRRVVFRISEPAIARGDPRLLGIALENLLGNAWKFTRNRPVARIEFGTIPHNGGSAFFVRDDGAGFDPQYAHRLFGAFQRLHSPREFEGDGIGLATVARIVRRHGGRVWAEGARERGATFYFTV